MNEEFKAGENQGRILSEIEAMRGDIRRVEKQIDDFTKGLGARTEVNEKDIARLDTKIAFITTIGSWILAPAFGVVVTAIVYLVVKK